MSAPIEDQGQPGGWWHRLGRRVLEFASLNMALLVVVLVASAVLVAGLVILGGLKLGIAAGFLVVVLVAGVGVFRLWNGSIELGERLPGLRVIASGLGGFVLVGLLAQAIPYGRGNTNPPVLAEPVWDSPRTRELAVLACFDCHSNETEYPWYAQVAPFSWALQDHVEAGRKSLNFSEWNRLQEEAGHAAEMVLDGSMPPFFYTVAHPAARFTSAEKQEFADGLTATLGD